ncbi:hypothetical protein EMIT0P294_130131 [Pseudomonas sp. IT-P294]
MDETDLCFAGTDNRFAFRVIALTFHQLCPAPVASVGIRAGTLPSHRESSCLSALSRLPLPLSS